MGSWRPVGSTNSPPWRHDNDDPASAHGSGGQASQQFPVPDARTAIASYIASQPPQPHTCTRRPRPLIAMDISQPPRRHNYAPPSLQPWAPHYHLRHRAAPGAASPRAPTFAPPAPSLLSSWTVRPISVMVPGEVPDASPDGGAAGDGLGCLRVARSAGRKAAGEGRNFVLSPLSLHAALALVAAGANGQTRRELLRFLGAGSVAALQRAATTKLVCALRGLPQTAFACGVWVDRRRAPRPEFAEVAGAVYAAAAESVDFASQAEQARQRVNAFVTDATNGLIRGILPAGSVDSSTVVVLASALYFKGTWALPFDPSRTFAAPFHLPNGATVHAPFMTSTFKQQVAVFPGFKALKLPYKNVGDDERHQAAFHMLLLLPDGKTLKVSDLYDRAVSTPAFIGEHTPAAEVPVGRFMVPKFKFTFEFEASQEPSKAATSPAWWPVEMGFPSRECTTRPP
ncbi:hypothetical protein ACP70R_030157 [Stipagrostis hirtigluma subsp. patula]